MRLKIINKTSPLKWLLIGKVFSQANNSCYGEVKSDPEKKEKNKKVT